MEPLVLATKGKLFKNCTATAKKAADFVVVGDERLSEFKDRYEQEYDYAEVITDSQFYRSFC